SMSCRRGRGGHIPAVPVRSPYAGPCAPDETGRHGWGWRHPRRDGGRRSYRDSLPVLPQHIGGVVDGLVCGLVRVGVHVTPNLLVDTDHLVTVRIEHGVGQVLVVGVV